jgi:hypothetical protein
MQKRNEDDFQLETVISDALVAAIDAFWKKFDDDNWDLALQYDFRVSLLDNSDYRTVLRTVRMDNIVRPCPRKKKEGI